MMSTLQTFHFKSLLLLSEMFLQSHELFPLLVQLSGSVIVSLQLIKEVKIALLTMMLGHLQLKVIVKKWMQIRWLCEESYETVL